MKRDNKDPSDDRQELYSTTTNRLSSKTGAKAVTTRDPDDIRRWAARHRAEPATGEASASGPATTQVTDGGTGLRFNFPGFAPFRSITWDEWFEHFDQHGLAFVYEEDVAFRSPLDQARDIKECHVRIASHLAVIVIFLLPISRSPRMTFTVTSQLPPMMTWPVPR